MGKFKCINCGSEDLGFQKYVKYVDKVLIHQDDNIEYYQQEINENDTLGAEYYYLCICCGTPLILYGASITTENELKTYINLTDDERREMLFYCSDEEDLTDTETD